MKSGIYLDNSMTTRPSDLAIAGLMNFLSHHWGTPSAPHQVGQELLPAIEESLKNIYLLVGAKESDLILFTSSGAEAVNHAIFATFLDITRTNGKNQYITSQIDEAPAIMSISRLEQLGCHSKTIQPNAQGIITAEMVAENLSPRTALVSLSWANGLTGVIQPVAEISRLCQERGVKLHLDATHVLGKLFYELEDIHADFISFNGDHIHAPPGTGGLYIANKTTFSPFIVGGLEQAGHRAGNPNIPSLMALGIAAKEALECRDLLCTEVARLRDKLEKGITIKYPEAHIHFIAQERLPQCTTIAFPGISNEALLFALNRRNVFASIGGGSFQQISLILTASGIPLSLANSAISFSLSRYTTEEEIDRAIEIISETAHTLRKTSQHFIGNLI